MWGGHGGWEICNQKKSVYIFAFGEYNSKQVNVSGIKIFRAQFRSLKLRREMLNAANIYLLGIILTKCKYIYTGLSGSSRFDDTYTYTF